MLIGLLNALFKVASRSRATAIGLAVVAPVLFATYYGLNEVDTLRPGLWLASFLLASALLNVPLAFRGMTLALNRADLVLVYVMLLVVHVYDGMSRSLPIISALLLCDATINGRITRAAHAQSALVQMTGPITSRLGGLKMHATCREAWMERCSGSILLMSLYVAMISAAVILRRQWMERERLAYPLTQVGLAMVRGEREKGLVNGFFRSRAMWCGAAIPLFFGALKGLHSYDPSYPLINLSWVASYIGTQTLQLRVVFSIIGFSYLINTHISAGLWFFHLLAKAESEALALAGMRSTQTCVYGIAEQPYLAYQAGGALIAMVLMGLWVGRQHLRDVLRKALTGADDVDDSDEVASYRGALCGLVGGSTVVVGWLWLMGTKLWVALLFVVLALLIFIGISRIVAEAGLAAVRAPMIAPDLVMQGLGSTLVGSGSVFNMSLAYIWASDIRIFILALMANGLKLIEEMDRRSRRLVLYGAYLAVCIGAFGSCWMVLNMAYRHGGINLVGWFFKGGPAVVYDTAVRNLEPAGIAWNELGFFALGGGVMLLLTWARQQLLWWPLHPLGFAVAANHLMNKIWFSIFIAWVLKCAVMRYGGPAFYLRSQRFFLGLIAGEALINGLWIVVDYITGHTRNIIFILG